MCDVKQILCHVTVIHKSFASASSSTHMYITYSFMNTIKSDMLLFWQILNTMLESFAQALTLKLNLKSEITHSAILQY